MLRTLPQYHPHHRPLAQHALHPFDIAHRIRHTHNAQSARAERRGVLQREIAAHAQWENTPQRVRT
jgi:hypothetical protein